MAFVYRSQKKSIFEDQIFNNQNDLQQLQATLTQESKSQERTVDLARVVKGLPSSQQKMRRNQENKQGFKGLPQFQVKPIHKSQSYVTLKQILYLNKTHSKLQKEEKQNYQSLNRIYQAQKSDKSDKSSLILSTIKKALKMREQQQRPLQNQIKIKKQKQSMQRMRSQPNVVNKNLLKTLSLLRSKENIPQSFQQINMISEKQCKTAKDSSSSKRVNFKSINKLSPIKYQNKQNVQQKAINLFINNKALPKIEAENQLSLSRNKKLMKTVHLKQQMNDDQEQQKQYEEDATPGPGAYNFQSWNKKKQFRSKRQKFGKIFYSSLQRFQNPSKLSQVTIVREQKEDYISQPSTKNTFTSFLSKSPRFEKQKSSQIPPPGYYNTRQTLHYDLIRNLLKGSNSDTFICTQDRHSIIPQKKEILPGPGFYHVDSFVDKVFQDHGTLTSSYKSKLTRNLHPDAKVIIKKEEYCDSILQTDAEDKFNPIHVQDASMLPADYQIDVPPFMSSSSRFPSLKPISKESFIKKKTQMPLKKQITKQAFNSSQKRSFLNIAGNGVGVGLYNITANEIWQKKSHNILFN